MKRSKQMSKKHWCVTPRGQYRKTIICLQMHSVVFYVSGSLWATRTSRLLKHLIVGEKFRFGFLFSLSKTSLKGAGQQPKATEYSRFVAWRGAWYPNSYARAGSSLIRVRFLRKGYGSSWVRELTWALVSVGDLFPPVVAADTPRSESLGSSSDHLISVNPPFGDTTEGFILKNIW